MSELVTDQIPQEEELKNVEVKDVEATDENPTAKLEEALKKAVTEESTANGEKPEPPRELTESEKLIQKRTGYWPVKIDPLDLKWIKNACNNKFEFTGANEAYMLMNCFIGFSNAVEREKAAQTNEPVLLPASAIEACAFFLNKYSGTGIEPAQRSFRIAMAFNPIIMEMRELDNAIEIARKKEEFEAKEKTADPNAVLKEEKRPSVENDGKEDHKE